MSTPPFAFFDEPRRLLGRDLAGHPWCQLLAAAAVYVVSPIDLVPELVLPFIGLGDDAVLPQALNDG